MRLFKHILVASLVLGASGAASGDVDRILIDRRLEQERIRLLKLDDGSIVYDDEHGLRRREPTSLFLALLDPESVAMMPVPDGEFHVLDLITGERLIGRVAPEFEHRGARADELVWEQMSGEEIAVPLDEIDRLTIVPGDTPRRPDEVDDLIVLRNGDRLGGFVDRIDTSVALDQSGRLVEVPLERVAVIDLANPVEAFDGTLVWLGDGTIVGVSGFRRAGEGRVEPVPARGEREPSESNDFSMALSEIAAVAFDRRALVALGSIAPEFQSPGEGRRWSAPAEVVSESAALSTPDIVLPGPMTVRWVLPAGVTRFATRAELPTTMWVWGDCELVVTMTTRDGDEIELARRRLCAETPEAWINVLLDDSQAGNRRLTITVEEGRYGPIQDRVVLRRPMLLQEGNGQ